MVKLVKIYVCAKIVSLLAGVYKARDKIVARTTANDNLAKQRHYIPAKTSISPLRVVRPSHITISSGQE